MEFPVIRRLPLFSAIILYLSNSPAHGQATRESTPSLEFRLAADFATTGWKEMAVRQSDEIIFVSGAVALNGDHFAKVSFYNDDTGKPSVGLTLTDEGGKAMRAKTSQNLKKKLAILLNGKVGPWRPRCSIA